MTAEQVASLASTGHLTLWNVTFPAGFTFAELPSLRFLDLRGGSRGDLSYLSGATGLRALVVNQVRGLSDLSAISGLTSLRMLQLYGLARVETLPDLSELLSLRRIELGQLRGLRDWSPLTSTPALEELSLVNRLAPDLEVIDRLASHPTLREFGWYAPDVPVGVQREVASRLEGLAVSRGIRPEHWFAKNDGV